MSITSKVFDTLLLLIANQGQLLTKDEFINSLWPDKIVEEASLTQNIAVLRKIPGDSPGEHQYIVTVPGQGYRFVSPRSRAASYRKTTAACRHLRREHSARAIALRRRTV